MIWLIDYTHYQKKIDPILHQYRTDYLRIKNYKRFSIIGETAPVKTKMYGLGLLRIATILNSNGEDVRYLHYDMLEELLEQGADVPETVAFSCLCPTVPLCAKLAESIRRISPETRIFLGGVHVNMAPEETAGRFPVFDAMVTGHEKHAAEQIAGRAMDKDPECYADFSLLPYPLADYAINTFTAMGCPYACKYCADGMAPHFRASEDGQLKDMIPLLPSRNLVHFFDSVLGYNREGMIRTASNIQKTGHSFILSCDMRADLLEPDILKALEAAGFRELRLGMETSDDNVLNRNGRTLLFDRFKKQLDMIRSNSSMYISLYALTGLPGTTVNGQDSMLRNCNDLFRSGLVDEIKNSLYVPYPMAGVDYSERGVRIISENWQDYDRQSPPVFETNELSRDALWKLYLDTAKAINEMWLSSLHFSSYEDIPTYEDYYTEYIQDNYVNSDE